MPDSVRAELGALCESAQRVMRIVGTAILDDDDQSDDESDDPDDSSDSSSLFAYHTSDRPSWRGAEYRTCSSSGGTGDGGAGGVFGDGLKLSVVVGRLWEGIVAPLAAESDDEDIVDLGTPAAPARDHRLFEHHRPVIPVRFRPPAYNDHYHYYYSDSEEEYRGRRRHRNIMADTTATTDITPVESTPAEPAEAEPTKVESPKTEPAKAESSSKRESKSHRREKSPATETPEEKHARREERARRREARENRKAAEAAAMGLGIRKKDKQRRHSSEKSRAPAAHGGEASTSLSRSANPLLPSPPLHHPIYCLELPLTPTRSKSTGAKAASAAASSDAQVRDTSAARSEKRRTRLITYKDSATAGPQVARSEHRHHHHHDHSTPEAQAECRRCLKKQKKREKQAQEKPEAEAEAEAEDGPVPAGEEAAVVEGAEPAKPAEAPREKEEEFSPQPPTRRSSARAEASSAPQRKMSVRRRIEMPPPPGLPPERRSSKHGEKKDKEKGKGKGRPLLEFVIAKKHEKLLVPSRLSYDNMLTYSWPTG